MFPPVENIICGERMTVGPFHSLAQVKCPLSFIGRNFPALCHVRNNGIAHRWPTYQAGSSHPCFNMIKRSRTVSNNIPSPSVIADPIDTLNHHRFGAHPFRNWRELSLLNEFREDRRFPFWIPGARCSLRIIDIALNSVQILLTETVIPKLFLFPKFFRRINYRFHLQFRLRHPSPEIINNEDE